MVLIVSDLFRSASFEWKAHNSKVHEVQFGSSDEGKVCSLGDDQMFYLWDTSTTSAPLGKMHFDNYQLPPELTWKDQYRGYTTHLFHPAANRKKLFGYFFGYNYLLISSVKGKVVYEVKECNLCSNALTIYSVCIVSNSLSNILLK